MSNFKYDWSDLETLYIDKKLSTTQIAKLKGCGSSIVAYMLQKHHIEVRTQKYDWSDLKALYVDQELSMDDIARLKGGKCNSSTVHSALLGREIPIRDRRSAMALVLSKHKRRSYKGHNHPQWKGGKFKASSGYIFILQPDHPYANIHGYVREHRLVMEKILGRYLLPSEIVHHKNAIKTDNRPENLQVFSSKAEHLSTIVPVTRLDALELRIRDLEKQNRLLRWQIKQLQEQLQGRLV